MNRYLLITIICLPLVGVAQNIDSSYNGISFEEKLSWKQIMAKAKKEGKFIFIDCFATWCGPCKAMEQRVFNNKYVGDYFNSHFVSIRLQMDITKNDNKQVKNWYAKANEISKDYGVPAYPTLLYFDPTGKLVNRSVGYRSDKLLIKEAEKALLPGMVAPYGTYYRWLGQYQQGKRNYNQMAAISDTALQLGQNEIANKVADEYREYLINSMREKWYEPSNLIFMANFLKGSKDLFFDVFFKETGKVDSLLNQDGIAESVVNKVIQLEEIEPITKLVKGMRLSTENRGYRKEPNWDSLQLSIMKKYGIKYAESNVLQAKIAWFHDQNEWSQAANYFTEFIKKYTIIYVRDKPVTFFSINSIAWNAIFKRSVDKEQIDVAIACMEDIIKKRQRKPFADYIDTYANLLYKAGHRGDAIKYQQQAVSLNPEDDEKQQALKRMMQGKPTWPHYISNKFWDSGVID